MQTILVVHLLLAKPGKGVAAVHYPWEREAMSCASFPFVVSGTSSPGLTDPGYLINRGIFLYLETPSNFSTDL